MTQTLNIDAVQARELVFADKGGTLVLQADRNAETYSDFKDRYPNGVRACGHYIDDSEGQWFGLTVADCYDPPIYVVRASSEADAFDAFCDEFETQIAVSDADAADYPEDAREYNNNGTHIDTSNVGVFPLKLTSIVL